MLKMFPGDSGETGDDHDYLNHFCMILKWKMYLSIYTILILDRNDSWHTVLKFIVFIGVSTPPLSKAPLPLSCQALHPLKSANCPSPPF